MMRNDVFAFRAQLVNEQVKFLLSQREKKD
jgi:hypothetical protein